jgi:outer membrane protein OmpA-like peptidoglycan-associated protein
MFRSLARPLGLFAALAAFAAPAWTQSAVGGKTLDLVFPTQDISFRIQEISFPTQDIKFLVEDIAGETQGTVAKAQDIGGQTQATVGKTQDLQVKETATEIRIELAADVLFDFDKATIRPEAAAALHNVAEIIRDRGNGRGVRIDGHTDGKGSASYNQRLSERRAESVKRWLARKEGLSQVEMTTQGFGATRPVASNTNPDGSDNPEGRQKNRRVEIVLAK